MPKKYEYKYPWNDIREYFFMKHNPPNARITLKDVSERFNVPYQTVRRFAGAENWHGNRAWFRNGDAIAWIDKEIERLERKLG